jgi:hypothetical protein
MAKPVLPAPDALAEPMAPLMRALNRELGRQIEADPLAEIARALGLDRRIANLGRRAGSRRDPEADALSDAQMAGDVDADGEPIPYSEPRR